MGGLGLLAVERLDARLALEADLVEAAVVRREGREHVGERADLAAVDRLDADRGVRPPSGS